MTSPVPASALADIKNVEFFGACTGRDEVNIVACAIGNRISSLGMQLAIL